MVYTSTDISCHSKTFVFEKHFPLWRSRVGIVSTGVANRGFAKPSQSPPTLPSLTFSSLWQTLPLAKPNQSPPISPIPPSHLFHLSHLSHISTYLTYLTFSDLLISLTNITTHSIYEHHPAFAHCQHGIFLPKKTLPQRKWHFHPRLPHPGQFYKGKPREDVHPENSSIVGIIDQSGSPASAALSNMQHVD